MMRILKSVIVVALVIIAVVFGLRLLSSEDSWICQEGVWQQHGHPKAPMPTTPCGTTATPTVTPTVSDSNALNYSNSQMGFSANLPKDVEIEKSPNGTITITKLGPTQKFKGVIYDGYSINIYRGSLGNNKDMNSLITADIEQKNAQLSPNFKVSRQPSAYLQGQSQGSYYFAEENSQLAMYYYLFQKDNRYLLVSISYNDPGNKDFIGEIFSIVSSITML
jgi:hypothetical protein